MVALLLGTIVPGFEGCCLLYCSGSGYLSACMGMMMGEGGRVLGIERHPPLAQRSIASVRRAAPELLERGTVRLIAGNALDEAILDQHGPFDAIHVGAAADDLPQVGCFSCSSCLF